MLVISKNNIHEHDACICDEHLTGFFYTLCIYVVIGDEVHRDTDRKETF